MECASFLTTRAQQFCEDRRHHERRAGDHGQRQHHPDQILPLLHGHIAAYGEASDRAALPQHMQSAVNRAACQLRGLHNLCSCDTLGASLGNDSQHLSVGRGLGTDTP
jgi:hypothetical protein